MALTAKDKADVAAIVAEALAQALAPKRAAGRASEPTEAEAHWKARDVACPRGCGRADFRTLGGATGAHNAPSGKVCKA